MKTKEKPQLTQNEIAGIYDEMFKQQGRLRDSNAYYKWVLKHLAPSAGSRLLDIACGEGLFVAAAREQGVIGFGIDLSSQAAWLAKERLGVPAVSVGNGEKLPFANQAFDFISNIGSLEHFMNPLTGVNEMVRVLKPGGIAALVLPNSYYLVDIIWQVWRTGDGPSHRQPLERFATYREWRELLEQGGFKILRSYKYNFCFPRSRADLQWYRQHPKKILNLLVSPFIPFNLSNHFLYICLK